MESEEADDDCEAEAMRDQLQFCIDDITFILEEVVDDLLFEKDVFFQFAHALRIKDHSENDKYTKAFLERIQPPLIYDIVLAN